MTVGDPLLLKDLLPGFLCVIQYKGHELHFRLFFGVAIRVGSGNGCGCDSSANTQKSKEIAVKNQAQDKKYEQSAQADVKSAKATPTKASETATTIIATIFHVTAVTTRRPTHALPPPVLDADIKTIVSDGIDSFPVRVSQRLAAVAVAAFARDGNFLARAAPRLRSFFTAET